MSGLVGVVLEKGDCFSDVIGMTTYHSHLGTEYGGIATSRKISKPISEKLEGQGEFWNRFNKYRDKLKGECGIGVISDCDQQPIAMTNSIGRFCLATSGRINNLDEITEEMMRNGDSFSFSNIKDGGTLSERYERNTTEVVAHLFAKKQNLGDGIEYLFSKMKGSMSMVLLGQNKLGEVGVYAFRDMHGVTPLFLGRRGRDLAVASEDFALRQLNFDVERMLAPGEFIRLSRSGVKSKMKGDENKLRFCAFYPVYTGFPASEYYGRSVERIRIENGRIMAKNEKRDFDLVFGMPDSGKHYGVGFALESGKPLFEVLLKYIYAFGGRSFTPGTQEERDIYGNMKQVSVPSEIKGKRIVVEEDSLVRGTQLTQTVKTKLIYHGAKETHARTGCPPLMHGCPYLNSTRTGELAARRAINFLNVKEMRQNPEDISEFLNPTSEGYVKMVEIIRSGIGLTSLAFQTMEGMVEAIGMPKEKLCTYCWDGCGPGCESCVKK